MRAVMLSQLLLLMAAVWAGGYYMELANPSLEGKLAWVRFQCLGIFALPPLWLVYALHVLDRRSALQSKPLLGAVWAVPVVTGLLAMTNESHHLLWGTMLVVTFFHGPGKLSLDHLLKQRITS